MKNVVPLGAEKAKAARAMRSLADKVEREHTGMQTHKHIRDAARQVERGNLEGAKRHLYAATSEMTPQTLYRHGHLTDDMHAAAKQNMGLVHREVLRVKDIEDTHARNLSNIARMRDQAAGTAIPAAPAPSADINAPNRTPTGGADPSVASGPKEPSPTTSQNHFSNVTLADGPTPYHRDPDENVECPNCHKYNDTDARWCDQCGHKLPASAFAELSAQTGALAVTKNPLGKPGGPGLWDVKGMQLPPYIQNIAHALLRTGRAKDIGSAIAIARAATKKWLHGKNTKPEVRAASGLSDAEWRAKQATAHADHSITAADMREIFELACTLAPAIELTGTAAGAQKDQRNPNGTFGSGQQSKGKGATHGKNAQARAQTEQKIGQLRSQLAGLIKQFLAAGGTFPSKSKSSTPAQTGAGATSAKAASSSSSSAAGSSSASSSKSASSKPPSAKTLARRAALKAKINAVRAQIKQLEQQAKSQ